MNSEYPAHNNPEEDLGKNVETLNKYIWKDGADQSGLNNIRVNPEKKITGFLFKSSKPWDKGLFFIKQEGERLQNRAISSPFIYKVIPNGGRKSTKRARRNRRKTRRN